VAGGGGPGVGKGVALERGGGQRGVGDGGADRRSTRFERPVNDAIEREKGRERGGPAAGVLRDGGGGCRGAWPRPVGGTWQRPERVARGQRASCARCRPETERGGTDRWVAAHCRAALPQTGGSGLSAGTRQRAGCGARGPAREGTKVGRPDE
jgi:hypothetical protein